MQITHTRAGNSYFQAVNKNKQMLLSWSLIAYLSITFLCIAISYEISKHKSLFFKNWFDNNITLFSQL